MVVDFSVVVLFVGCFNICADHSFLASLVSRFSSRFSLASLSFLLFSSLSSRLFSLVSSRLFSLISSHLFSSLFFLLTHSFNTGFDSNNAHQDDLWVYDHGLNGILGTGGCTSLSSEKEEGEAEEILDPNLCAWSKPSQYSKDRGGLHGTGTSFVIVVVFVLLFLFRCSDALLMFFSLSFPSSLSLPKQK